MVSKCANPDCTAGFSYKEGQLLRFQVDRSESVAAPASAKPVRHFWLCKCCSETYRLEYHKDRGLLLIARGPHVLAAKHKSHLIAAA
jgi:hypothetical protein